jgi:hypothetical protein
LQNRKKTGTVQDGSSDIRICPPWHENAGDHSLIGDGWEAVVFSKNASAAKMIVIKRSNGCFSM